MDCASSSTGDFQLPLRHFKKKFFFFMEAAVQLSSKETFKTIFLRRRIVRKSQES
jgi:hypothetical protein